MRMCDSMAASVGGLGALAAVCKTAVEFASTCAI